MDGYTLKGNGILQCVPGVSLFYLIWNDSIPTCEEITATDKSTIGVITEQFGDLELTSSEDNMTSTTKVPTQECVPSTTPTLVFMGTTGGLAILLLIIAISWIVYRIRGHMSNKEVNGTQVTHTYLDMSRSPSQKVEGLNQGISPKSTLSRPLPGPQPGAEDYEETTNIQNTGVLYESIPENKLGGQYENAPEPGSIRDVECDYESATDTVLSDNLQGSVALADDRGNAESVDQDEFGYVLPNARSSARVQSNVLSSKMKSRGLFMVFDEDGYLNPHS
ncbi:uncharacterized protein LOC121431221 [Lytechinus variegatus]|uniref:uncharacterized protein LOC121431221 n=1 Tax=Lytechinus variegatus TaxID=7654 RepID=UPI001BB1DA11|nr:uncharacterized protein LOC121431221 [Lytechinus variegatus]